jgi:hypothetical protein
MLLPFVRWLYGTPSPDTPPYGLLPNMSESSGTPGESPGFSRLILRGEPPKVDYTFTYRRGVLHCAKLHTCDHGLLQDHFPKSIVTKKVPKASAEPLKPGRAARCPLLIAIRFAEVT